MNLHILLFIFLCGIASAQSAKELMIQCVVKTAIAPGYARLAEKCRLLSDAAKRFDERPDETSLQDARACWIEAAIASQELDCLKIGPIADAADASAFYFLSIRSASIERAIRAMPKSGDAGLQNLGATAKGLYAIEYLLFPKDQDFAATLDHFAGEPGEPRRHYLFLIARELARQAERLEKDWQAPYSESAKRFLTGGQDSLNALVNQMAMTTESVATQRMNPANSGKIPGAASGHSQALLQAAVRGLQIIHSHGLNDYTRRLNPALAERLEREFAASVSAESSNTLNVLHQVDLPSTLGVTLTFISTDGD